MFLPKSKAPAQTFEEVKYLRRLVDTAKIIRIKLVSGEEVEGYLEYWDAHFLRLTREDRGEPNLFIFKHEIRYLYEVPASRS